jgi:chorismate mutase
MTIKKCRAEIDKIDTELLRLLSFRARLAIEMGKVKRAAGLPINAPDREGEVLSRASRDNAGPLDNRTVVKLFRSIICESRRLALRESKKADAPPRGADIRSPFRCGE